MSSYSGFLKDIGEYMINSSSFFHFISINFNKDNFNKEEIDFTIFRVIGLDTYYDKYKIDGNLSNFNHWLYGPCNNETDTKGISNLIYQEYFNKSACIKKYFNSNERKYYNINEEGFKWPILAHGTFNPNNKFYTVFVEKCEQETLDEINDKELKCKDNSETEDLFKYAIIHFNFIDEYIDIQKYKKPIIKYFYRIENKLDKDTFTVNHLNFNPSLVRTDDGIIYNNFREEHSYFFNRNDVYIYSYYKDVYMVYYLWLNNKINYFERTYKKLQDYISNIGGTSQVIITLFVFFNKIFNYYVALIDAENLLFQCPCYVKEIMKKRRIEIQNLKIGDFPNFNIKDDQKNIELDSIKKGNQIKEKSEKNNFNSSSREQVIDKDKFSSSYKKMNDTTFISNKNNNYENNKIKCNKDNKNIQKENINFWDYLKYKISFGKTKSNIMIYENFRISIISVENIITNFLNINYILKVLNLRKE